jgi:hypothetical protein
VRHSRPRLPALARPAALPPALRCPLLCPLPSTLCPLPSALGCATCRRNKNKLSLIAELSEKQTLLGDLKGAFKEQQSELQAAKKENASLKSAAAAVAQLPPQAAAQAIAPTGAAGSS